MSHGLYFKLYTNLFCLSIIRYCAATNLMVFGRGFQSTTLWSALSLRISALPAVKFNEPQRAQRYAEFRKGPFQNPGFVIEYTIDRIVIPGNSCNSWQSPSALFD